MGRPLELTDDVAEAICSQVEKGLPVALAAPLAGFTRQAVDKWQRQGRADLEAEVDSQQARFVVRLERARARLAGPIVEKVRDAAVSKPFEVDWRAAVAALETLMPAHFGKKALELRAAREAFEEAAAQADEGAGQADAAVRVELVRCASCGEDQLPGKRLCGDCGAEMPRPGA